MSEYRRAEETQRPSTETNDNSRFVMNLTSAEDYESHFTFLVIRVDFDRADDGNHSP
jgi:hypothetical protein